MDVVECIIDPSSVGPLSKAWSGDWKAWVSRNSYFTRAQSMKLPSALGLISTKMTEHSECLIGTFMRRRDHLLMN